MRCAEWRKAMMPESKIGKVLWILYIVLLSPLIVVVLVLAGIGSVIYAFLGFVLSILDDRWRD
jgi:hypothetical protein